MTKQNETRGERITRYEDRLPVHGRALLPAIAAGLAAGVTVFYFARMMLERTPLVLEPSDTASNRDAAPVPSRG